jgi:pimeloyl-ACP methyl ester carboxylesterase
MHTVAVIDPYLACTETGQGESPVVFLHGSPTSSHLTSSPRSSLRPQATRAACKSMSRLTSQLVVARRPNIWAPNESPWS